MSQNIDRWIRRIVPSSAALSYNPIFKFLGDPIAAILGLPFPEFRNLPPNHLRVRVGVGNQILNNHAYHLDVGRRFWFEWLSRGFVSSTSDIVEIGSGCGRIALHLLDDWFSGKYIGVDIDPEFLAFCQKRFPPGRFKFLKSPHISATYSGSRCVKQSAPEKFYIAPAQSVDFVYSTSLYTHLLEKEVGEYTHEAAHILRPGGMMYMTIFSLDHVDIGGRWTFKHIRGNAHIESELYPEAAVAYTDAYMIDIARNAGFQEAFIIPSRGQSALVARK